MYLKKASCYIDLNTSVLNYTLPLKNGCYTLVAQDNGCWVKTADSTVGSFTSTSAALWIPEGTVLHRRRLYGGYIGALAPSAAGYLWIVQEED